MMDSLIQRNTWKMNLTNISHSLVDTESGILSLIKGLQTLPNGLPCLYIDLEGVRLSRYGSISIVTIFVPLQNFVYLVDVHKLQATAFSVATVDGNSLKTVLESPDIIKVFFDLRNDSDALHHHFGIRLRGVEDIQLMENAARPRFQRRYINGLDRCITSDAPISLADKLAWKCIKDNGLKLFHPAKGGSYEVFNERPLDANVERYCILDVQFLPLLRNLYWGRLDSIWKQKVVEETERRVQESQAPSYQPHSDNKKFGPWGRT